MKHNILYKSIFAIIICLTSCCFSGCWDYMEIQRRGYVLGVAIDKAPNEIRDSDSFEYMPLEAEGPLYAFTIQIPIISRSQNKPYGQSAGDPNTERDWNLTIVSNAFFEATREFSTILNFPPYFSHLQAIVISEKAAKDDMTKLLDMFFRDAEMRRRTKVYITPGSASHILNVIPKIDDYSSQYLRALPNNNTKTSRMLHKVDLGIISQSMHENRDFVLPKVIATKKEIKDAGCAVFKDNKMVGWLDEIKTNYLKWVTNFANGGLVTVNSPHWSNYPIVLEIRKVNTKQRPIVKDNSLGMQLDIKAHLSLGELAVPGFPSTMNSVFLSELERLAEEQIKKQIEQTIAYVQKQYNADIFLFGINFERYAPKAWEIVKDNWDEVFTNLAVTVNVKVKISQIGLIK
jgi:Ger(x)C family germination protein